MQIDEMVRSQCGDYHETRYVLTLRILAIDSDPDLRSRDDAIRRHAQINNSHLSQIIRTEWAGRRGPRYTTIARWSHRLIGAMSDVELTAFREQVFELLAKALPPTGVPA